MKRRWFLAVGLLCTCLLLWSCYPSTAPTREKIALADVADRLGIEPNLEALTEYITSTLEEAHDGLAKIGPYTVEFSSTSGYELVAYSFGWGVVLRLDLHYSGSYSGLRLREVNRVFSHEIAPPQDPYAKRRLTLAP